MEGDDFERAKPTIKMQVIWGLQIKGLQSYCLSNFKNDLIPGGVEPRPIAIAHTMAIMVEGADILGELQL